MASNYYLGRDPADVLGESTRYFYALRRNLDGELFFVRIDLLSEQDTIDINTIGERGETFEDFEEGIDFFEGIAQDHEIEYDNLVYPQYRWDDRSIFYYIDDEGRFVQRLNRGIEYTDGNSSDDVGLTVAEQVKNAGDAGGSQGGTKGYY